MLITTEGSITQFRAAQVDLLPSQVAQARASRDFLLQSLRDAFRRTPGRVSLTDTVHFYGSFARRTKIRPLNDIDLLFVVDVGDVVAVNNPFVASRTIQIHPNSSVTTAFNGRTVDRSLIRTDSQVSSIAVLNDVRNRLQTIPQYRRSEVRPDGPAVVLNLASYDWSFDIVPALQIGTPFQPEFAIPDGRGGWIRTNPLRDSQNMTQRNQQSSGYVLPMVRLAKSWNSQLRSPLPSYYFEMLCLQHHFTVFSAGQLNRLEGLLYSLSQAALREHLTVSTTQINVREHVSDQNRHNFLTQVHFAYATVQQAQAAVRLGQHRQATALLQRLFGDRFPLV